MADIVPADNEDSRGSVIEIEPPKKPEPLVIDLADDEIIINVKSSLPNSITGSNGPLIDECNDHAENLKENGDENNEETEDVEEREQGEKEQEVDEKENDGETERVEETDKETEQTEDDDETAQEEEERENEEIANDKAIKEGNEKKGDTKEVKNKEEEEDTDDEDEEDNDKERQFENDCKKSEAGKDSEDEKEEDSQGEKNGQTKEEEENEKDEQAQEGSSSSDIKSSDSNVTPPIKSKSKSKSCTSFPLVTKIEGTSSFTCDPVPSNSFGTYPPPLTSIDTYPPPLSSIDTYPPPSFGSYSPPNSITSELRNAFSYSFNSDYQSAYSPGSQTYYSRRRFSYMSAKRQRMDDSGRYHPDHWTPDMVKYYDDDWDHEEFNVEKLQSKMDKDPSLWQISSRDVAYWRAKDQKPEPRCYNCLDYGHETYNCPEEKKPPKCHMCGLSGHIAYKCPHSMCLNCGTSTTGYVTKCRNCRFGLDKVCERCNLTGHIYSECTDHWRLYHSTTGTKRVKEPREEIYKPPRNRWCCNCGRRGHFQVDCGHCVKNYEFSDTLPFVSSYVKAFTRGSQLCYGYEDSIDNGRLKINVADNIMTNPSQKHNYHRKTSQLRNRLRAIKRASMRNDRDRNMARRRHPAGGFNRFSFF